MQLLASITDRAGWTSLHGGITVFALVLYVLTVIALWRVFSKAGYPGILAIIPIVNAFILTKVAGLSAWWTLLYLIPVVNLVLAIIVALRVGRGFGKGGAFSFFLLWLPMLSWLGYMILGFGSATYRKPV